MKKFGIILLVFLVVAIGIVYYFRYDIIQFFQQSAEAIIKKNLPPYVSVERIIFDLKEGTLEVKNFGIKNPKGYKNTYLATISSILCRYKKKSENILDGIEVTEIVAREPLVNIERLRDGRFNVNEMDKVMALGKKEKAPETKPVEKGEKKAPAKRKISDIIKLTDTINIKDGKVIFTDKAVTPSPYVLAFEEINGNVVLGLTDDYAGVNSMASKGRGVVNGDISQRVDWTISLRPGTERLTMSNRYEVDNVDIIRFKPYYDPYSPIIVKSGSFSGTLVFDFDNGNIGSMNTIRLKNLAFEEKKEGKYSQFWGVMGADLIKYLQSSPREIVFDFKIKGSMDNPRFYPGPIVNDAIQRMTVDKISDMIMGPEKKEGQAAPAGEGGKSDAEQVMDVLRGLLKK